MPNKSYLRGRKWEWDIMKELKRYSSKEAFVLRAAGSHGPYDVVRVDPKCKGIVFVQAKTKYGPISKVVRKLEKTDTGWAVSMYRWTKYIRRNK